VKNYFFKVAKLGKKAELAKTEGIKPYFDRCIWRVRGYVTGVLMINCRK